MNIKRSMLLPSRIGKSCFKDSLVISILYNIAVIPITANKLKMLLPTTLLTAIALLPLRAEDMDTAASVH